MKLRFFLVKMGGSSSLVGTYNGLTWEVLGRMKEFYQAWAFEILLNSATVIAVAIATLRLSAVSRSGG